MKITILVKGNETRYATRFSVRKLISGLVLVSLVMLVSSRSTESVYENQIRLNVIKTGLEEQSELVNQLKINTEQQVNGMVGQLADMQVQLERLDIIGKNLAQQAGLSVEDFVLPEQTSKDIAAEHRLTKKIEKLSDALSFKIQQLNALESILIGLNIELESKLAGRPIEHGWLSSYYGIRKDPFTGKPAMHKGIDFAGKSGSAVIATGAGVVTWSGERYGYGKLVEVDHGNGLKTRYGHNDELTVSIGDVVTKGQMLAKMGNTGRSTGAHVHYEVIKNGAQVDPLPYIYR
ncbi:M23 family metallopeptidase [Agaribacter flavus]|uniref:M23 family metallopeptidase n=1 Tax=Agaribacter flavus TaxID=1902781 RepID=A0ABV7FP83_9ALTE